MSKEEQKAEVLPKGNKWSKYLKRILLLLLLLIILSPLILHIGFVQNWIAGRICKNLSEKTQSTVSVGDLDFSIFRGLLLKDLYISSPNNPTDTLAFIGEASSTLKENILSLINSEAHIEDLNLFDAKFKIIKKANSSEDNLKQFLKNFVSEGDSTKTEGSPIILDIRNLNLRNLQIGFENVQDSSSIFISLNEGHVGVKEINLAQDSIIIESLSLFRPVFRMYNGLAKVKKDKSVPVEDKEEPNVPSESNFYLAVENLEINEGFFKKHDLSKAKNKESSLDVNDIEVTDLYLVSQNFEVNGNNDIVGRINRLSLKEKKGFEIKKLAIDSLRFNDTQLLLSGLDLNTQKSTISDYIEFKYNKLSDFGSFAQAIEIDADMTGSEVTFQDLIYFFPDLKNSPFFKLNGKRKFRLTGKLQGTVDDLYADNMFLSIDNLIELSGSLSTNNLTNSSAALINLYVDELNTSLNNLKRIIPGFKPPEQFYKLDPISFTGDIEGFFNDFVIYGNLESRLGSVILDTRLDTRGGVNEAKYSGEVFLNDFNLSEWTDNPNLGFATVKAKIENGKGLTLETVKTDLIAEVERFDFRGYSYSNVVLEGILEENLFDGDFTIKDPNIDVDFSGQINITDNYIKSDFTSEITNIDLIKLNLSKDYSKIQGNFDMSVEGSSLTDLIGSVDVKNLDVVFKDKPFDFGKLYLSSAPGQTGSRNLLLTSDILNASLDGTFDFAQLGGAVSNYIYNNHPLWASKMNIVSLKQNLTNAQDFNYKIDVFDTKDYLELANLNDLQFKGFSIYGDSDLLNQKLETHFSIDSSFYKDYVFNNVGLDLTNDNNVSNLLLNLEEIATSGKSYEPLEIISKMKKDEVLIQIKTSNVVDSVGSIDIGIKIVPEGENLVINLINQNLQMFSKDWEIDNANRIVYGNKFIDISDFVLSDGYRTIFIEDYNNKGIELNLNNFDFLLINGIINYNKIDFAGEGTVFGRVANIFDKPQIVADIQIPEFTLNGVDYGALGIRLDDDSGKTNATINLNRVEDELLLLVNASLDKESKALDGTVKARNLVMSTFEFIIDDGISETAGFANIDAQMFGSLNDIKLDGSATVINGKTKIDYLGNLIQLGSETFTFSERFIDLTNVRLFDRLGNQAIMTGGLNHYLFGEFSTDLNMKSEYFLALDTDKIDNPSYYGTGLGQMNIDYFGPFSSTDIIINAVTGTGTILNIPIEDTQSDVSQDFITFFKREDIKRKKVEEVVEAEIKLEGVDVEMNLTLTQDAQVNMIFDERTNDIIKGNGDGNMRITISRDGSFNIYGGYEVASGDYLFTAFNVVSKPFKVKPGGQITWTGDPINANLNIKASYDDLSVPVNVFLAEYLQDRPQVAQDAKKRTVVDLKLMIGGTLYKPIITFDMEFPELQGELRSFADSKMRTLRQNDAELNEQVAGLVMFRSFLPSSSSGGNSNLSRSVVGTTYNTLTEMLSSQLSNFLSGFLQEALTDNGFISGLDFEFGVSKSTDLLDSSPDSQNYLPDEIEVHFKPRFQNDKWGFDYGTSYINNLSVENYFIHDFVLEYYLTADRKLKLRAYGKWDKDIEGRNEQKFGVGLNYRKEFGSMLELKKAFTEDLGKLKGE